MFWRRLISAVTVVALLVTSGAMAVARGQSDIGTLLVLCTGAGIEVVTIDVDGEPVERGHICPDCVLTLAAAVLADTAEPARPVGRADILGALAVALPAGAAAPEAQARGPPVRV